MVPGEGPQPALGMIVGEAPGFQEDEQGRPFVGPSGRLLDTALVALGIPRSEVFITNAVKVVPVNDAGQIRKPSSFEIIEWAEVLQHEIQNTAPAAILALGRTATDVLVGIDTAGHIPFGSKIGHTYTAWHPSYVLRQGRRNYGEWIKQLEPWAEAVLYAEADFATT